MALVPVIGLAAYGLKTGIKAGRALTKSSKLVKGAAKATRTADKAADAAKATARTTAEVAESGAKAGREKSTAEMARRWQLENGGYGKADDWIEMTLRKGDIVWSGSPGQSNFYTSDYVARIVGNDATKLYQGLQVGKGNYSSYRPGFTMYEVQQDVRVAYSKARANNHISKGGFEQYFIPNYEQILQPIMSRIMTNR